MVLPAWEGMELEHPSVPDSRHGKARNKDFSKDAHSDSGKAGVGAGGEAAHSQNTKFIRNLLIDAYAPSSVLIDSDCLCVGSFGPVHRYLHVSDENGLSPVLAIAREGVRQKLAAALHLDSGDEPAPDPNRAGEQAAVFECLSIAVLPVRANGKSFSLVSFLDPAGYSEQKEMVKSCGLDSGAHIAREPVPFATRGDWHEDQRVRLSPRQRTVLDLVTHGYSNKQIAARLEIAERTVETHRVLVMRKFGAKNLADLMRLVAAA
jgi:DNA-binding CsgD family transcriptional regulator